MKPQNTIENLSTDDIHAFLFGLYAALEDYFEKYPTAKLTKEDYYKTSKLIAKRVVTQHKVEKANYIG